MNNNKIKWLGTPEERILSIRNFRKFINSISFEQAALLTQQVWNNSPKINASQFNINDITSWPTPWELFEKTVFEKNTQCLGAFYTLVLSKHRKYHDIKLAVISNIITNNYLAIILDNCSIDTNKYVITNIITANDLKTQLGE
jgi:hypothetical protein